MIRFNILKSDGKEYDVLLLKHKNTNKWQFINMTKGHICPCEFKSVAEAITDLHGRFECDDIAQYTMEVMR